jgi:SlyX protein
MREFSSIQYDHAAMEHRFEDLEIRIAYQEASIEELTNAMLAQQKTLGELQGQIDYLKSLLKDLTPSAVAPMSEETAPPHY